MLLGGVQKREHLGEMETIAETGRLLVGWIIAISNYIRGDISKILEPHRGDDNRLRGGLNAHPEECRRARKIRGIADNLDRGCNRAFQTKDGNLNYVLLNFIMKWESYKTMSGT